MKWRDGLINAGLVAGSLLVFFGGAEIVARVSWPAGENLATCTRADERTMWSRLPNCRAYEHNPESTRVEYVFDACGERNVLPCDRAAPQTALRIAAIGDSMTEGALVEASEVYVDVAARRLTAAGRPANVRNFAVGGWDLLQYFERMDAALEARPRVVVLGLGSNDLFDDPSLAGLERMRETIRNGGVERAMRQRVSRWKHDNIQSTLRTLVNESRALLILQHYLFRTDALYFAAYRARGATGNYLAKEYGPDWRRRIEGAAEMLRTMDARARQAGARFVVVLIPQRVQAVMLGLPDLPAGFDPRSLGRQLQAAAPNVEFVDFIDDLSRADRPGALYFPVDGHLTAPGHRLLGEALARRLAADPPRARY